MESPDSEQSTRDAEIVDRHLPDGYAASPDVVSYGATDSPGEPAEPDGEIEQSSLVLQGGDMHRDIFKIKARAAKPKRSATFSATQSPH